MALTFGDINLAADPIPVLSMFKEVTAPKRLSVIVEAESLFNDGTAAEAELPGPRGRGAGERRTYPLLWLRSTGHRRNEPDSSRDIILRANGQDVAGG